MDASLQLSQRDLATKLLGQHGVMRLSDLRKHGVNPATLARMLDEGVLFKPSRGLYELADAEIEASHSLAEVAARVPKAVVCLTSALSFHEITLQLPRVIWIAIGSNGRKPTIDYPPIGVVYWGDKALTLGVNTHLVDSVPVQITSPARSIVDCFRFRNKVGLDVAMEALRMGWRSQKVMAGDLVNYAQTLRIWSVMRPYVESVVADEG